MPAGTIVNPGSLVSPGGQQGTPGPNAVSTDAGNQATLGSDNRLYVPAAVIAPGVIWEYAGTSPPTGWLMCDGSAISRTTYAALFAIISTNYGAGDGSTTFNVPDTRSRTVVGAGGSGSLTNRAPGTTGGEETHALTVPELAVHTHVQNPHTHIQDAHSHMLYYTLTSAVAGSGAAQPTQSGTAYSSATTTATNQLTTPTNQNTGSGTAHNTMPPFIALNRIIKT